MEIAISFFKIQPKVIQLKKTMYTISTETQNFKTSIDMKDTKNKNLYFFS